MTCPDWRRLDPAVRDASGAPGAPSRAVDAVRWQEALSHLDSGCPRCWQEALAVDPTLIFRRLPAPELAPAREAEEVEAARVAVAAMRTASRLDAGNPGRLGGRRSVHSLASHHTARWALAAGLTAMALVYGSGGSGHGWHPAGTPIPAPAAGALLAAGGLPAAAEGFGSPSNLAGQSGQSGQSGRAIWAGSAFAATTRGTPARLRWAPSSAALPAASRPSIEGLSRPEARVYQLDSPHMSVVMIVDDKLDV
jgi:hypothetical protein